MGDMFVKRPTADEDDDDLLEMQKQWEASREKPSVTVQRMQKKTKIVDVAAKKKEQSARFEIDVDQLREENPLRVLFPVEEKNTSFLTDDRFTIESTSVFSKSDGFPEPLDLSAYYKESAEVRRSAPFGKSFFAAEFDRIHGNLEENLDEAAISKDEPDVTPGEGYEKENETLLKSLGADRIEEMRSEIAERLDPKTIQFLMNRSKKPVEESSEKPKISKFKARRLAEKRGEVLVEEKKEPVPSVSKPDPPAAPEPQPPMVEHSLNELEILDDYVGRDERENYDRLATDAVQLDFASKFGRSLVSRQERSALRLFDNCKNPPKDSNPEDNLLKLARSSIDEIKKLYLEEVEVDGAAKTEFASGLNPIVDGSWMLVPIRRVLDAVESRGGKTTKDDVEIVRLALLWTLLLAEERKSAFVSFAEPTDVYIRISEVFQIGPELLADRFVVEATGRLLDSYVTSAAIEGRMTLRMSSRVSGLDAFMPFYEDLLRRYDEYSLGDSQFTKSLLLPAYLNAAIGDSLEYRYGMWMPQRSIVRQMTIKSSEASHMLKEIKRRIREEWQVLEEQFYVQYSSLLAAYAAAIRDSKVERGRNELLFEIGSYELGCFVKRHSKDGENYQASDRQKQFDVLVQMIHSTVKGKLSF